MVIQRCLGGVLAEAASSTALSVSLSSFALINPSAHLPHSTPASGTLWPDSSNNTAVERA